MRKVLCLLALAAAACGNSAKPTPAGQGGAGASDASLASDGRGNWVPGSGGAATVTMETGSNHGGAMGPGGATGQVTARGGDGPSGGRNGSGGVATAGATSVGSGGAGTGGKATQNPGTGGKLAVGSGGSTGRGGSPGHGGGKGGADASAGGAAGGATWSAGPPESGPVGYGSGTTGGGSAAVVEVSSMAALQAALDAYAGSGGLSLRYTGRFDFSTITDPCTQHGLSAQIVEIKKKSDITLVGADGSAASFGIHIAASSSNIIVRNMVFGLLPGGGDSDAISIEGMSGGVPSNIWIDHNELFSSMVECAGAGDTSFDGLIDLKKGADKVTVSYNYIHDHHKVSLNGYSDSDTAVRHITFHHNVFDNVASRTPLQRGGYSHLFNNYFHQVSTSGANIRMGGYALIEANYFDTVANPVTARDSSAIGYWELRDNNVASPADFATFNITWVPSDSQPTVDATDWKTTASYPEALGYGYSAQPAACLQGLPSVAGAGKGLATLQCH